MAPSRPRRRRLGVVLGVAAVVLAADIISKTIVVATLSDRHCLVDGVVVQSPAPIRLLGGVLTLCESRNPGAAFGIGGTSTTIVFTAIALGVIAFIIRTSRQIYSLPWAVALGLLLGGAMGNLTDRIFRSPGPFRGWVVDWIQLPHWPVFNLADSSITCGVVLFVLLAARGRRLDGTTHLAGERSGAGRSAEDHQAAEPAAPEQPTAPTRPKKPWQQHPSGGGGG
ncbi:MAG TPA: signal peptidase II [Streptosporangiaceae bacterium]|nr:signal peptidase II [Streptosporangiaceae bacterium]